MGRLRVVILLLLWSPLKFHIRFNLWQCSTQTHSYTSFHYNSWRQIQNIHRLFCLVVPSVSPVSPPFPPLRLRANPGAVCALGGSRAHRRGGLRLPGPHGDTLRYLCLHQVMITLSLFRYTVKISGSVFDPIQGRYTNTIIALKVQCM